MEYIFYLFRTILSITKFYIILDNSSDWLQEVLELVKIFKYFPELGFNIIVILDIYIKKNIYGPTSLS